MYPNDFSRFISDSWSRVRIEGVTETGTSGAPGIGGNPSNKFAGRVGGILGSNITVVLASSGTPSESVSAIDVGAPTCSFI